MNNVGLITEYNPFHNGHLLHINKSKQITNADNVIVVMSGNFVQRGNTAFINKYDRAKIALQCGADLVIELPTIYATSSAEFFAQSSVSLLHNTNIVNSICFGAESPDLQTLSAISDILVNENDEYKNILKQQLDTGISYPLARYNTLKHFLPNDIDTINNPNNILSIEYLKALKKLNSKIEPYTIQRETSSYHSTTLHTQQNISSATAIRTSLLSNTNTHKLNEVMPQMSYNIMTQAINQYGYSDINNLSNIFHYILNASTKTQLSNILYIDEGLENRIIKSATQHYNISDIINATKTKRYTYTRIHRAILNIILNITKDQFNTYNNNGMAQYIRILGFRRDKQFLLQQLQHNGALPVITNPNKCILPQLANQMLQDELTYTNIFNQSLPNYQHNPKLRVDKYELTQPIVVV